MPQLREQKLDGPLEEQRARRNFLTWAFFLAQASAAELLVTGAAKAQADEPSENPLQHSDPQVGPAPTDAMQRKFDVAEAEIVAPPSSSTVAQNVVPPIDTLAQTPSSPLSAINGQQQSAGTAAGVGTSAGVTGTAGSMQAPIESGGSTDNSLPNVLPDIGGSEQTPPPPITVDIGLTPLLGFDVTIDAGGLISTNIGLDLNDLLVDPLPTVTGLLGSLTDDLGHLLNSDVLGLGEILQSSPLNLGELTGLTLTDSITLDRNGETSPAAPLSIASLADTGPTAVIADATEALAGSLLGSGGVINFTPQPAVQVQTDELYALGRYTDYNIALRDSTEPAAGGATPDVAVVSETPPADDHAPADPATAEFLHLDELITRPAV